MSSCVRCGKPDSTMSKAQYSQTTAVLAGGRDEYGSRYAPAREKLCHTCWKWELGPEFADIWLIFHEIAEAYPDSPK